MPQHGQQLDPGAPSHFPFQHPGMSSGCWNWMSGGLKRANRPRIIQLERGKKKPKNSSQWPLLQQEAGLTPRMVGQGVLENVCLRGRIVCKYAKGLCTKIINSLGTQITFSGHPLLFQHQLAWP